MHAVGLVERPDASHVAAGSEPAAAQGVNIGKQWGGVFKKQAGRLLDGRTCDEFPRAERAA
jgi:protein gp37